MDYRQGFAQLKSCLEKQAPDSLIAFHTLEDRFKNNEKNERTFGSSENTRNERSQVIYALNELALKHCGISFNDFCQGKMPSNENQETSLPSLTIQDPQYDYSNMEWYSPKPPELMYEDFTKFQAKTNFEAAVLLTHFHEPSLTHEKH